MISKLRKTILLAVSALLLASVQLYAQNRTLSGKIIDAENGKPIEFASVFLSGSEIWTVSDEKGEFILHHVPQGIVKLNAQCLGYVNVAAQVTMKGNVSGVVIRLRENNLTLKEVVVTATRKTNEIASTYVLDRKVLDHEQILNVGNITSLLPGGKSFETNLASSDNRITLRSNGNEMGNASFGTAVDIDGVRLDNNSLMGETKGAGLRSISASNIESVEIITGIPSVEYGDLTSGIVKINTKKGRTPYIIDFSTEPRTKQIAVTKGFQFKNGSTLNTNLERARSFTNLTSPHTSYTRNGITLNYSTVFNKKSAHPVSFTAGFSGNLGGYRSESDPDTYQDEYSRQRDANLRANVALNCLLDRSWITNLNLNASVTYSDRLTSQNDNKSTSSTQPWMHSLEEGYFVGALYDEDPNADLILSPVGYWYELSKHDSRPLKFNLKLKADKNTKKGRAVNKVMYGLEYTHNRNFGRGHYYEDPQYTPTWREYRYDRLPAVNNLSAYVEDNLSLSCGKSGLFKAMLGIRYDFTGISQSEYGGAGNFSPRLNLKYEFFRNDKRTFRSLSVHGGIGRAVKLPSFEILYPSASYSDKLAFAPGTMADGTTFYAYYSIPSKAIFNPDLKWQSSLQNEIGLDADIAGTRISVTAFLNRTFDPYMFLSKYTPYSYRLTTQANLEGCPIPSSDRRYTIDRTTGVVTAHDITGKRPSVVIDGKTRNTFKHQNMYINGSAFNRTGLEWVVDFTTIPFLNTQIRMDGKYYRYKGLNETIVPGFPSAASNMANGDPYKYIGYYKGSSGMSASSSSSPSVSNGRLTKEMNLNFTATMHIPQIRLIFSLRFESSLYDFRQELSELKDGTPRGIALETPSDYFGNDTDLYNRGRYVAVYPEYFTTWENPDKQIPFLEAFEWARDNNRPLYNELAKLVLKSNRESYFDSSRITAYFSANLNVTKEIGKIASVSFYAKNFFNNTARIQNLQTHLEQNLFGSGYIPKFYYGISLRLKI